MLKYLLASLAGIIVLALVVAAFRPDDFKVTRAETISAPAAAVFAQINNLQKWPAWSPWARLDPNAKNTFEGPPAGVGASMAWVGNREVGEGRMTITESKPGELVLLRLEFIKPFAATNTAEFALIPEAGHTTVVWTMTGKNNYLSKCVGLVMNFEKIVGGQFEQGLANLKAIVEKPVGS